MGEYRYARASSIQQNEERKSVAMRDYWIQDSSVFLTNNLEKL